MAAHIAHITKLDGQIAARLPLNVKGVVDGVGQLVGAVVDTKRDRLAVIDNARSSRAGVQDAVRIGKIVAEV